MSNAAPSITFFNDEINLHLTDYFDDSRQWLDAYVDAFVLDSPPQHLIIVGGPGLGKSAYAAHLARRLDCPRYFTRTFAELELASTWLSPRVFLVTLGQQIREKYGPEIFGDGVEIHGEVDVDRAYGDAEAVGTDIEEAHVSPFRDLVIRGSVKAKSAKGRAQLEGVRIGRLYDSTLSMNEHELLHEAVLAPLARLAEQQPDERVIVLVDGLDVALQHGEVTLLDFLPRAENLRVIATSRPGQHLDRFAADPKVALSATKEIAGTVQDFIAQNREDAARYVHHVLTTDAVIAPAIADREAATTKELAAAVAERSEGNFLYLRHYFEGLRTEVGAGRHDWMTPHGVPTGLHALYRVIVTHRLMRRVAAERWEDVYTPILGVLSVAREPLTRNQIAEFSGVKHAQFNSVRRRIEEFLEVVKSAGVNRYRFYHSSFAEFLHDTEHNPDAFHAADLHWSIAAHFQQKSADIGSTDWTQVEDSYPFRHMAGHLSEAGERGRKQLFALIDRPWMDAKLVRFHSNQSFSEDVDVALRVAAGDSPDVVELTRLCLVFATLGDMATATPAEALAVLVHGDTSDRQLALGEAHLIQDAEPKVKAFELIGQAFLARGELHPAADSFAAARQALPLVEGDTERGEINVRLVRGLAQAGALDEALSAIDSCEINFLRAKAWIATAEILAAGGKVHEMAKVLRVAQRETDPDYKPQALVGIGEYYARADRMNEARHAARAALDGVPAVSFQEQAAEDLTRIGCLLVSTGDTRTLGRVDKLAESLDTVGRSVALQGLATVYADARDTGALHRLHGRIGSFESETSRDYVREGLAPAFARVGEFDEAAETAYNIWDPELRAKTQGATAMEAFKGGETQLAIELATDAFDTADQLDDPIRRTWTMMDVIPSVALVDSNANAQRAAYRALASSFDVPEQSRAWAQHNLATALAAAGVVEATLKTIEAIEPADKRIDPFRASVEMFARLPRPEAERTLDAALQAAESFNEDIHRCRALAETAAAFESAGLKRRAREAAKRASALAHDLTEDGKGLAEVAMVLARMGQHKLGLALAHHAISLCRQGERGDPSIAARGFARAFTKVGDIPRALRLIGMVDDPYWRCTELRILAEKLADDGEQDLAAELAADAFAAAEQCAYEGTAVEALCATLPVLTRIGPRTRARRAARLILAKAKSITDDDGRASTCEQAVRGLVEAGFHPEALRAAALFCDVVEGANDLHRASFHVSVVDAVSEIGDSGTLSALYAIAPELGDSHDVGRALAALAGAFANVGDFKVLTEILKDARELDNGEDQAEVLAALARAHFDADDADSAGELLTEAWDTTFQVNQGHFRERAMSHVFDVITQIGDAEFMREALDDVKQFYVDHPAPSLLGNMADALAEAGMNELVLLASVTVDAWSEKHDRQYGQQNMCIPLAKIGEFDKALKLARRARFNGGPAATLIELSRTLVEEGEEELARRSLDEAVAAALGSSDEDYRDRHLDDAGKLYLELGEPEQARLAAGHIATPWHRASALEDQANTLAYADQQNDALTSLIAALNAARLVGAYYVHTALANGAVSIAHLDDCKTLRRVVDTLSVIDELVG